MLALGHRPGGAGAALAPLRSPRLVSGAAARVGPGTHPPCRHCRRERCPKQQPARPGKSSALRPTQCCLCSPSAGPGSAACSPLWQTGHGERDPQSPPGYQPRWRWLHCPSSHVSLPGSSRPPPSPKDNVPAPSGPPVPASTTSVGPTPTHTYQHCQRTPGQSHHPLLRKILLHQPSGSLHPFTGAAAAPGPWL